MYLVSAPAEVRAELGPSLAECETLAQCETLQRGNALDFAMLFTQSRKELVREFSRISQLLVPAGMLWVSWPKKSSGVATDVDENAVREIGLNAGLVDVKVCAVTEVWSGLKFVRRVSEGPKSDPRLTMPEDSRATQKTPGNDSLGSSRGSWFRNFSHCEVHRAWLPAMEPVSSSRPALARIFMPFWRPSIDGPQRK